MRRPGDRKVNAAAAASGGRSLPKQMKILYVSGEESGRQLKMRAAAAWSGVKQQPFILAETSLSDILAAAENLKPEYSYRRFHYRLFITKILTPRPAA